MQAKAILEQTELEISKEVSISRSSVLSAKDSLVCAEDYLKSAEKQFDIAFANYKVGTNTIISISYQLRVL